MEPLDILKRAVLAGEEAILEAKERGVRSAAKGTKEFVTNCDIAAENAIIAVLKEECRRPRIYSEEAGYIEGDGEIEWVVDPIDGTHNFMYGLPDYGISIAACRDGKAYASIVRLPEYGDTFYALKGAGAFQNDKRIFVSMRNALEETLVAYDNQFHRHPAMIRNLPFVSSQVFTLRISGSAVVDIARVSNGTIDARIFHKTKWVDFAAGSLLVREAGGSISNFLGEDVTPDTSDVIVSNGRIHNKLVEILGRGM